MGFCVFLLGTSLNVAMHSHIGGGGGGETGGRVAASLLPVPQMTFHRGLDRRVDLVFLAFHLPIFRSNVPFTYFFSE